MMEQSPFWSTTSSQARLNSTSLPLVLCTGQTSWARSQSWGRKFCNTVCKVWVEAIPSLQFSHRKHVFEFEALGLRRAGWWCLGTWLQLPTQKCSSKWKWSAATGMANRRSSQKTPQSMAGFWAWWRSRCGACLLMVHLHARSLIGLFLWPRSFTTN